MIESNAYILRSTRLKQSEQQKRIAYLENTMAQLQQYHKVYKPLKRRTVFWLIVKYETILGKFKGE